MPLNASGEYVLIATVAKCHLDQNGNNSFVILLRKCLSFLSSLQNIKDKVGQCYYLVVQEHSFL